MVRSPLGWLFGAEMVIGIERLGKPRKHGPHLPLSSAPFVCPLSIPVAGDLIGIVKGESRSADADYADSRRKFAKCPVASVGTAGGCPD